MKNTFIHLLMIFLLIFTLLTPGLALPDQSSAAAPNDIKDHWAYNYISRGIELGFISGYPDGTFLPDNPVSRAEFSKMMNSALGNVGTATISFNDVPSFEWFYNDVSKAVAATYVDGYGDGTFLPNNAISRQEAAVMIARIVPSHGITSNLTSFQDGYKTADWAREYMQKIVGKSYLGAYDDGLLHPEESLTRAQTAKIICNILDSENIVKAFTTIKKDDTVSKNTIYSNTLTLSKDLDEGDASFQNSTLLGGLLVNGGGKNTITIENSRISKLNINKAGSTVRVLAKGATTIPQTIAQQFSSLETLSLTGGIFGKGFSHVDVAKNADTSFTGYFPSVNITGTSGIARLDGCSITNLIVSKDAKNSNIYLDSRSAIASTDVNAIASFHGNGTIKQLNANVSGITYETKPKEWALAKGVTEPKKTFPDLKANFIPENGSKNIALKVKPTISFLTNIETIKGDTITAAYLKNNLVFKKGSSRGATVEFTATLSSNKRVITVSPTLALDSNQAYYLGFAKDKFRSTETKETIAAKSVVFTTLSDSPTVSIKPANGSTQVATNAALTITFSEAVYTSTGKVISSEYLANNITITKSSGGSNLNSLAASMSGNVVTIPAPVNGWEDGTSYTITVLASSFKNASSNTLGVKSSTFITGTSAPVMNIYSVTKMPSSITVKADSTIPGQGYFIVTQSNATTIAPSATQIKDFKDSNNTTTVPSASGTITTTKADFIITGLTPNVDYTLYGLVHANGKDSTILVDTFTTPLPDAELSALVCTYTVSGASIESSVSALGLLSLNIPEGASNISLTASANSDITIAFPGSSKIGESNSWKKAIEYSELPYSVTISTQGPSFKTKFISITLAK